MKGFVLTINGFTCRESKVRSSDDAWSPGAAGRAQGWNAEAKTAPPPRGSRSGRKQSQEEMLELTEDSDVEDEGMDRSAQVCWVGSQQHGFANRVLLSTAAKGRV